MKVVFARLAAVLIIAGAFRGVFPSCKRLDGFGDGVIIIRQVGNRGNQSGRVGNAEGESDGLGNTNNRKTTGSTPRRSNTSRRSINWFNRIRLAPRNSLRGHRTNDYTARLLKKLFDWAIQQWEQRQQEREKEKGKQEEGNEKEYNEKKYNDWVL